MSINVSPRGRDLNLNLSNSCNCCCWRRSKISNTTQVYVTSQGEVKKFDPQVVTDEVESLKRAMSNLKKHIYEVSSTNVEDAPYMARLVEMKAGIPEDTEEPVPLTLSTIHKVNRVLQEFFPHSA